MIDSAVHDVHLMQLQPVHGMLILMPQPLHPSANSNRFQFHATARLFCHCPFTCFMSTAAPRTQTAVSTAETPPETSLASETAALAKRLQRLEDLSGAVARPTGHADWVRKKKRT